MGGMISLELASAAPKRVRSLTLMVTTRGKYQKDPRADKPLRGSTFSKDPSEIAKFTLELLYPSVFLEQKMVDVDSSVRDALFAMHEATAKNKVSPKFSGLVGQLLAVRTHYVSDERLAAINSSGFPILLVGSMLDILIPPQESLTLRQHLSGEHVKTLFFDKGGHGVTVQYSEEIVDALLHMIQQRS
jgi:pimeloyl-ACP methyl ester carboxylesterase